MYYSKYDAKPSIEVYEACDDLVIEPIHFIQVSCAKWPDGKEKINIQLHTTNTLDHSEKDFGYALIWPKTFGFKRLDIERVLHDPMKNVLRRNIKKACRVLMAKIELLEKEGWTRQMIQDWFDQNVDTYIAAQDNSVDLIAEG